MKSPPDTSLQEDARGVSPPVIAEGNRISIVGPLRITELHLLLAVIHRLVIKLGYTDIVLDFARCTAAFAGPMLAVCAQILKLRAGGLETEIVLPEERRLQGLFKNASWAYLLDPVRIEQSHFRGTSQVPVTQFTSASEQSGAVNAIMDAILSSISYSARGDLAAIEWSVSEITDNVLQHSECPTGGLVQMTTFKRTTQRVEYAVCDAGIGIPASLRRADPVLTSDSDALDRAIREGVTRDTNIGQGNGLFGSYQICTLSRGYFEIHSGYASLSQTEQRGLHIRRELVPYTGALIIGCVDFSKPNVLANALRFGGKPHTPIDYIENRFESHDGQRIVFKMDREASSFGSRAAALPVRTKVENLMSMCEGQKIFIDLADIPVISSSFADEVFGKLFNQLGPIGFMQRFEFVNSTETVRSLIDRALSQRAASRK